VGIRLPSATSTRLVTHHRCYALDGDTRAGPREWSDGTYWHDKTAHCFGLNKSSALTSVSDTITRLQQERDHLQKERDLALRRQRELHDFYLAKIKGWETDKSHLSISIWTLDRDGNK